MDWFTPLQPWTFIPGRKFLNQFVTIRRPEMHGGQNGPPRLVRRHMVRPGNVIVVGGNAGPIGQHPQEIAFRLIVHGRSVSEGLDQVKVMLPLGS
jgi:hypothetical protein